MVCRPALIDFNEDRTDGYGCLPSCKQPHKSNTKVDGIVASLIEGSTVGGGVVWAALLLGNNCDIDLRCIVGGDVKSDDDVTTRSIMTRHDKGLTMESRGGRD